jgi:putative FmdB family regulatory protein
VNPTSTINSVVSLDFEVHPAVPLYEYQCLSCNQRFEKLQKFSDPPVSECPACGSDKVSQLLSAPAVQFKGSGWYVTDYARSSGGAAKSNGSSSSEGSKAEPSSSEKSESKTPASSTPSPASGSSEK